MGLLLTFLFVAGSLSIFAVSGATDTLWPLPIDLSASGPPLVLSPALAIQTTSSSGILKRGISRYLALILRQIPDTGYLNNTLNKIVLKVRSDDETLQISTSYWYILQVNNYQATIDAKTPFGALYGLETFSQLIEGGKLINNNIFIVDQPRYLHRGVMLDTGRRIFPFELLYNILDGMSYVKLNVLHFHLSDYCRFSVESKLYPELQDNVKEFYTQEQVRSLVAYAADRGIRVIPEVESLAHVNGMASLANKINGLKFCNASGVLQLYNDPEGVTLRTMKHILEEMMSLFPDNHFHLGLDETDPTGKCTKEGTRSLEEELIMFLAQKGKMAYAWEEAFTSTSAATPMNTVLQAWRAELPLKDLIDSGFLVVNSLNSHFYLNKFPNASALWTDIAAELTPGEQSSVLGGEVALWTDYYCYIKECLYPNRTKPVGWWMYGTDADSQFTESAVGLIWPQSIIAAGSFYNYQSALDPDSEEFEMRVTAQHKRMVDRSVLTCPPGCVCDYLSRCGVPYPHP